jgi:hypothetical protein
MRAYCYILSASHDPDRAEQSVPYAIDEREIFFGPCKKRLRKKLRDEFLTEDRPSCEPHEDIYLIGFNGSNGSGERKIIWAGRVRRIMTFATAHADLRGARYKCLTNGDYPPLHVKPVYDGRRKLIAYARVGCLHAEKWTWDLVQRPGALPQDCVTPTRLSVPYGYSAWNTFDRDTCLLLENTFYATRGGIAIGQRILELLKAAQPDENIDDYAVFGRRVDGSADGRVGSWLRVDGEVAQALVSAIKREAKNLPRGPFGEAPEVKHCAARKAPACAPPTQRRHRLDKVCV